MRLGAIALACAKAAGDTSTSRRETTPAKREIYAGKQVVVTANDVQLVDIVEMAANPSCSDSPVKVAETS